MAATATSPEAQEFLRASASTQRLLARALSVGEPWISRQVNGTATGPTAKFYDTLQALAESAGRVGPRVQPGALVVGALVVLRRALSGFGELNLHRLVTEGIRLETRAEAAENEAELQTAAALAAHRARPTPATRADAIDALRSFRSALVHETSVQVSLLLAVDAELHALEAATTAEPGRTA